MYHNEHRKEWDIPCTWKSIFLQRYHRYVVMFLKLYFLIILREIVSSIHFLDPSYIHIRIYKACNPLSTALHSRLLMQYAQVFKHIIALCYTMLRTGETFMKWISIDQSKYSCLLLYWQFINSYNENIYIYLFSILHYFSLLLISVLCTIVIWM